MTKAKEGGREERKYGAKKENTKNFPKILRFNLSLKCFRLWHTRARTHTRTHANCHWQFSPKTSDLAAAAVAYLLLVFNPFHQVLRLHPWMQ